MDESNDIPLGTVYNIIFRQAGYNLRVAAFFEEQRDFFGTCAGDDQARLSRLFPDSKRLSSI